MARVYGTPADSSGRMAALASSYCSWFGVSQSTTSPEWVAKRRSRAALFWTSHLLRSRNRVSLLVQHSRWVSGYAAKLNSVSVPEPGAGWGCVGVGVGVGLGVAIGRAHV